MSDGAAAEVTPALQSQPDQPTVDKAGSDAEPSPSYSRQRRRSSLDGGDVLELKFDAKHAESPAMDKIGEDEQLTEFKKTVSVISGSSKRDSEDSTLSSTSSSRKPRVTVSFSDTNDIIHSMPQRQNHVDEEIEDDDEQSHTTFGRQIPNPVDIENQVEKLSQFEHLLGSVTHETSREEEAKQAESTRIKSRSKSFAVARESSVDADESPSHASKFVDFALNSLASSAQNSVKRSSQMASTIYVDDDAGKLQRHRSVHGVRVSKQSLSSGPADTNIINPAKVHGWAKISRMKSFLAAFKQSFIEPPYGSFVSFQLHKYLRTLNPDQLELPHGTVKHGAVLFSDASGFTAMTQRLAVEPDGAEKLCQIINDFFTKLLTVVYNYGGDVVKVRVFMWLIPSIRISLVCRGCALHNMARRSRGVAEDERSHMQDDV